MASRRYAPPPVRFAAASTQPRAAGQRVGPTPPALQAKWPTALPAANLRPSARKAVPPPPIRPFATATLQRRLVAQKASAAASAVATSPVPMVTPTPAAAAAAAAAAAPVAPTAAAVAGTLRQVLRGFAELSSAQVAKMLEGELKEVDFPGDSLPARRFAANSANAARLLKAWFLSVGARTLAEVAEARSKTLGIAIAARPGDENLLDFPNSWPAVVRVITEDLNAMFHYAGTAAFDGGKAIVNFLRMIRRLES